MTWELFDCERLILLWPLEFVKFCFWMNEALYLQIVYSAAEWKALFPCPISVLLLHSALVLYATFNEGKNTQSATV